MDVSPNSIVNSILILLLATFILFNYRSFFSNKISSDRHFLLMWIVLTVFSVFYMPEGGDNQRLYEIYDSYIRSGIEHHLEPFYFRLIDILPHNYYLFRFIIWGLASLFLVLTCKKLRLDSVFSTCVVVCVGLITCYYYLRNVLGICILFYVLSRFISFKRTGPNNLLFEFFLEIGLLVASYFTHSSMPLYFLIAVTALIIPFNKTFFFIIIAIMVFVAYFWSDTANAILGSGLFSEEVAELGQGYVFGDDEGYQFNFFGLLWRLIWLLPYAFILIYGTTQVYSNKNSYTRATVVFLIMSNILYFSSLILMGSVTYALSYRLQNTSFIYISIFLILFLSDKRNTNVNKLFWTWILVYTGISFIFLLR